MKKVIPYSALFVMGCTLFLCCNKTTGPTSLLQDKDLIAEAKAYFIKEVANQSGVQNNSYDRVPWHKTPLWNYARVRSSAGGKSIEVPVAISDSLYSKLEHGSLSVPAGRLSYLLMYKDKTNHWKAEQVIKIPGDDYLAAVASRKKTLFGGLVLVKDWQDNFISGIQYNTDGRIRYYNRYTPLKKDPAISVDPGLTMVQPNVNCVTTDWYTCSYAASDPSNAYCSYTYSETICSPTSIGGNIDAGNINYGVIGTGGSGGGTGSVSGVWVKSDPTPFGGPSGKLCGTYKWKAIGNAYYAQINVVGFSLVNPNGDFMQAVFSSLCIQVPISMPTDARNKFVNDMWNNAIEEIIKSTNASGVIGGLLLKQRFYKYLNDFMSEKFGYSASLNQNGCSGNIPASNPVYCK